MQRFEISTFFCTWLLQQTVACYRLTLFSGAEIGSENCKFGICAPFYFGLNYYTAADLYSMVYETAKAL